MHVLSLSCPLPKFFTVCMSEALLRHHSILFTHETQRLPTLHPSFQNEPADPISSLLLSLLPRFQATDAKTNESLWCSRQWSSIKTLPPAVTAQQTVSCAFCLTVWPLLYWQGLSPTEA